MLGRMFFSSCLQSRGDDRNGALIRLNFERLDGDFQEFALGVRMTAMGSELAIRDPATIISPAAALATGEM